MPGTWEEKFKEAFTSLFIEGVKTMKDPKMKLTAEISAQMARDRYENWDLLLQRWAIILKISEDPNPNLMIYRGSYCLSCMRLLWT